MIAFFLQLLIPLALMFYRFKRRKYFVVRAVICGALFVTLAALWREPTALFFVPAEASYFLFYMTCYLMAFMYVFLCFDMPIIPMLFFVIVSFIVQNLSHHTFELIMRIAGVPMNAEYSKIGFLFLLGGIYAVVYALFFFVFMRKMRPEDFVLLPKAYTLAIAGAFFLVMIVLGVYVRHIRSDLFEASFVGIGYELYSVILDAFLIGLQFGVFRNGRLRESNEELERRLEHEGKYYETAKANMDLINTKCHDLKYQIAALETMQPGEERKHTISELKDAVMIYDSIAKTGNGALDCILTEKGMYCQQSNIDFTVIADGKSLATMRHNDIYALFGNAIDNAIESVMKIEDTSKRVIALRVDERGGQLFIHLENYCGERPEFADGLPKTTKRGEGHGFGMKSIRYIVDKYKGNLTLSLHNNIFALDILLPL